MLLLIIACLSIVNADKNSSSTDLTGSVSTMTSELPILSEGHSWSVYLDDNSTNSTATVTQIVTTTASVVTTYMSTSGINTTTYLSTSINTSGSTSPILTESTNGTSTIMSTAIPSVNPSITIPLTTTTPAQVCHGFDGWSFFGGIILGLALCLIVFLVVKYILAKKNKDVPYRPF